MTNAVEIHNISKSYRISSLKQQQRNLQTVLLDALATPVRRVQSLMQNSLPSDADQEFWALRDITFNIREGETMGLVGVNGSGKSTLLKLIANIAHPNEGYIKTRGRLATILEVGTGFHQELSGRENLYIYGSVLGMSRQEIDERFEQIMDFADIHNFIDTPFKRYSSGMKIRLGFSVAAHLITEIMIVDEVFAVGDAAFREKCLQKLEEVAASGRTVIVVSHAGSHIRRLCDRVAWLHEGKLVDVGATKEMMDAYYAYIMSDDAKQGVDPRDRLEDIRAQLAEEERRRQEEEQERELARQREREEEERRRQEEEQERELEIQERIQREVEKQREQMEKERREREREERRRQQEEERRRELARINPNDGFVNIDPDPNRPMTLRAVRLLDSDGRVTSQVDIDQPFRIQVDYDINQEVPGHVIFFIKEVESGIRVLGTGDADMDERRRGVRKPGSYRAEVEIPAWQLDAGQYTVIVNLAIPAVEHYDRKEDIIDFDIIDRVSSRRKWYTKKKRPGLLGFDLPWRYLSDEPVPMAEPVDD